ncbi:MAG: calcium-binding protein [Pseudomonadota bacterium]
MLPIILLLGVGVSMSMMVVDETEEDASASDSAAIKPTSVEPVAGAAGVNDAPEDLIQTAAQQANAQSDDAGAPISVSNPSGDDIADSEEASPDDTDTALVDLEDVQSRLAGRTGDDIQSLTGGLDLDLMRADLVQSLQTQGPPPAEDTSELSGTDGDDVIGSHSDTYLVMGMGGNDSVLGNDNDDENIFGDDGDDVLFGEGGADLLVGDAGDDLLVGGAGDDDINGATGSDTMFGGAGDDVITDTDYIYGVEAPDGGIDAVNAGDGDDRIYISEGLNVVTLGDGADTIWVGNDEEDRADDPIAVITDFDPSEDGLILTADTFVGTPKDLSSEGLSYVLEEIETESGFATVVIPTATDPDLAAQLADRNVGVAVLQGLRVADLQGSNIQVAIATDFVNGEPARP